MNRKRTGFLRATGYEPELPVFYVRISRLFIHTTNTLANFYASLRFHSSFLANSMAAIRRRFAVVSLVSLLSIAQAEVKIHRCVGKLIFV